MTPTRIVPDSRLERKDAPYWRKVYEAALEQLAELRAERDARDAELEQLNQEIVRFEQLLTSINPLRSDAITMSRVGTVVEGIEELGLADACREILKANDQYRTARGIRDSLAASGYNLSQHTNPLASIHGVLKRMAQSGEVEELETEGKTRYRWKSAGKIHSAVGSASGTSRGMGIGALRMRKQTREEAALEAERRDLAELERRKTVVPPIRRRIQPPELTDEKGNVKKIIS